MNSTPKPELTALGFATGIVYGLAANRVGSLKWRSPKSHIAAKEVFDTLPVDEIDIRFAIIIGVFGESDTWTDALRELLQVTGLSSTIDGTIYLHTISGEQALEILDNTTLGRSFWTNRAVEFLRNYIK